VTRLQLVGEGAQIAGRLKIWPGDLDEIQLGKKRADCRRCDDRKFRVGEVWELAAWDPQAGDWIPSLPSAFVRLTHIERMAGPLMLAGVAKADLRALPVAVLSFEVLR
jgi:Domain of unknown function (DUF3850)